MTDQSSRRFIIKGALSSLLAPAWARGALAAQAVPGAQAPVAGPGPATWVSTTRTTPWRKQDLPIAASSGKADVNVKPDERHQTIEGFGACFNELGWQSLGLLSEDHRQSVLREFFAPGVGANFSFCRMPLGANDFSRDWYSYDETPGDFSLKDFSIKNDLETLVPFIKAAQSYRPDLKLWASPWSPPSWMKTNKHYALASAPSNGLAPDQERREGTDAFILEDRYLRAYAAYFARFIRAYRDQGITVGTVMPQNEFNSSQVFPSCTWTPRGLARFVAALGPEMQRLGVEIFLGTIERPDERLVDAVVGDPRARRFIKGAGFQWAGRHALPGVGRRHPGLRLFQTEQECGDGNNDWRYCRYAWNLMKHYLGNGVQAYMYWNMSLERGGLSHWGWAQNSLVTVDRGRKTFAFNHEYYLMKHVSHFVLPGATRISAVSWTGYENQLAFVNSDGRVVIVIQNDLAQDLPVRIRIGDRMVTPTLPADSFNTIAV